MTLTKGAQENAEKSKSMMEDIQNARNLYDGQKHKSGASKKKGLVWLWIIALILLGAGGVFLWLYA